MKNKARGTIRAFDVDFVPCDCIGTKQDATRMQVVPVKWKRTDNNPNGRVRFQCMRCKHSWSMNNIRTLGGGLHIDESHPEEVKRRRKISPYYNEDVAVNLGPTPGQAQFPGGQCNLIGGTRASARMS